MLTIYLSLHWGKNCKYPLAIFNIELSASVYTLLSQAQGSAIKIYRMYFPVGEKTDTLHTLEAATVVTLFAVVGE